MLDIKIEGAKDSILLKTLPSMHAGPSAFANYFKSFGYDLKSEHFFSKSKIYCSRLVHPIQTLPDVYITELFLKNHISSYAKELAKELAIYFADKSVREILTCHPTWHIDKDVSKKIETECSYIYSIYTTGLRPLKIAKEDNLLSSVSANSDLNSLIKNVA